MVRIVQNTILFDLVFIRGCIYFCIDVIKGNNGYLFIICVTPYPTFPHGGRSLFRLEIFPIGGKSGKQQERSLSPLGETGKGVWWE